MKVFDFIKAEQFFPKYAPGVIDWKKKKTGRNGRGNPLDFSEQDKKEIREGIKKMFKDLESEIKK